MKEELSFHERFNSVVGQLKEIMKINPEGYKEERLYPNRKHVKRFKTKYHTKPYQNELFR